MEKVSSKIIYDLAVIGNGIAAQSFLWNLSLSANKSQNFSIAHVFSNQIAPPCSNKSSATVSLNGIEEDVSQLGNDMREAFFLFDELVKNHHPEGVESVTRTVISTNEIETKKLTRRYKSLIDVKSDRLINSYPGIEYNSYIISPEIFSNWLKVNTAIEKTEYPYFVRDITKVEDDFQIKLQSGEVIVSKKILFAIGAYGKIFERLYAPPGADSIEVKNMIKAGSYLEREVNLGDKSFYLSIDGNQVLYRKNTFESKLIIGSITTIGAYEAPDVAGLFSLHEKLRGLLTFDLGDFKNFKVVTGLRHKGPKRLLISECLDNDKKLYRINGLYKNGYTLGPLAGKRMVDLIFK